jgi:ubiquitin-conjugating enzyme E2 variant
MVLEVIALLGFGLLVLRLGWNVVVQASSLNAWWMLLPAALIAYLAADFLSGMVHWFCDSFYREDTPLVGTLVIKSFREHHRDPHAICRHGFVEVNANNCLGVSVPLLIELWVRPDAAGYTSFIVRAFLFAFALAMFGTNQFHKWAHAKRVPNAVAWLQQKSLILKPSHHQIHHRGRYDHHYCITTGWMNLMLDRIHFFQRFEWCIRSLVLNPSRLLFRSKSRGA